MDITTNIGKIKLKNPIMSASGTFSYGLEMQEWVKLDEIGAVVTKGLSKKPIMGNPPPRIVETSCGMLNAIGLENIGVDAFIKNKLPILKSGSTPVVVNIFATSYDDFQDLTDVLVDAGGIIALEINVSCPNVKEGGIHFGTNPKSIEKVVSKVKKKAKNIPVWIKLSPNVTDIVEMGKAAINGGVDGIVAINTFPAMSVDLKSRSPMLANVTGGLSGPAIKPIALKSVWELAKNLDIPVIGVGGINTVEDVLGFLMVGASAVEIGTATFRNPETISQIISQLPEKLKEYGFKSVNEVIGSLEI